MGGLLSISAEILIRVWVGIDSCSHNMVQETEGCT